MADKLVVVEVGAEKTKAILLEKTGSGYTYRASAEAATTVEPPILDVVEGVKTAVSRLSDETLWDDSGSRARLLCSSGDAGGLYMVVAGVIGMISRESAERAALGAGAHLLDAFSKDDARPQYSLVETIRGSKPDIFLLAGGTDGGAVSQVLEMAELINRSDVRPRFGDSYKLPVIYAGNVEAREKVTGALGEARYATRVVANVRPEIERENLGPAKEAIYDSYMEHVIVHAPGYEKLAGLVEGRILPSQATVGKALYAYAEHLGVNLLGVDVGSATTDVYSVYGGAFNRSLNAEAGLTYGLLNVLKTVGVEAVQRWLPFDLTEREVRNAAANLTVLQPRQLTDVEEVVRGAVAREAIRLSVEQHKRIASRLKGVVVTREMADLFSQSLVETNVDPAKTRVAAARGAAFNGSPETSALLLMDALAPVGATSLLLDSEGLLPHCGVLMDVDRESAIKLMTERGLTQLGLCVAPAGSTEADAAVTIKIRRSTGHTTTEVIPSGSMKAIPLRKGEMAHMEATPSGRLDLGSGRGKKIQSIVAGSRLGVIIDTRGRPLPPPKRGDQEKWLKALAAGGGE